MALVLLSMQLSPVIEVRIRGTKKCAPVARLNLLFKEFDFTPFSLYNHSRSCRGEAQASETGTGPPPQKLQSCPDVRRSYAYADKPTELNELIFDLMLLRETIRIGRAAFFLAGSHPVRQQSR